MKIILLAIGLVLAVEGALYALFPIALKRMITYIAELTEDKIRVVGLLALGVGVILVWLSSKI